MRRIPAVGALALPLFSFVFSLLTGCAKVGCLEGKPGECTVPSPCTSLSFSCDADASALSVSVITSPDEVPGGLSALGAPGDYRLANDQVIAVVDALDHPHFIAPSGGSLLDLASLHGDDDALNHIEHVTGVLPSDAFLYDEARVIEEEGLVGVQFRGSLAGRPSVRVATRYELRPCEPGVRVRSEIVNLEPDPVSFFLSDGWYFGGRNLLPFVPTEGGGFDYLSFGLSTIGDAVRESPFLVTAHHTQPGLSYATVSCNTESGWGFHSEDVSTFGLRPTLVMPRDWLVYERFVGMAEGPSVAPAADLALELRRQLWGEPWVELSGRVVVAGSADGTDARLGDGTRAAILISEGGVGTPKEERIPWTQIVPAPDGSFRARVPTDREYLLEIEAYGQAVATASASVADSSVLVPDIEIPAIGSITVTGTVDGNADPILAFVKPADDETDAAVRGKMFGRFSECAPLLGPPHGGSPACDRVLFLGSESVPVLPGTYDIFAVAGPFSTMAAVRGLVVEPGGAAQADLAIETLDSELVPEGALSSDFHVHGAASFDSSVPDEDRVRAFLAARMDVIASTDHDISWDYADAMTLLGANDRMRLMVGVETTGHILFRLMPENQYPQVIGHWNFWPFPFDAGGAWRGAPWDELLEPGQLMTRVQDESGWDASTGVAQLNHPIEDLNFGRDLGYASTLGLDGLSPLPRQFDGTPQSMFLYTPPGSDFANSDYHAQEVMNGTENHRFLSYRALWFYFLSQGILKAGTANSDSHGITDNVLGTPRTLVFAGPDVTVADFDEIAFNAAVREGRMVGTNGPVIVAETSDAKGAVRAPSLDVFTPGDGAGLHVVVRAAPWVPVDEVRVVVNGEIARTITDELADPLDPLGTDGLLRLDMEIPFSDLLPGGEDAWVVVEAGHALEPNLDLDCDGFPDTGDNNRDGAIDWHDVEAYAQLDEEPEPISEGCYEDAGPLARPEEPADRESVDYLFSVVVPNGYVSAFTNPLLLDVDGDGFEGSLR